MARRILADRFVKTVKPAAAGKRDYHWDAIVPSLALRVTDKGHRSWIVQRRVNGKLKLLTLGDSPAIELADARDKARDVLKDMDRGRIPTQVARVTASAARKDSFESAVEDYIKREVEKNRRERTAEEIVRPLRKLFVPRWGTLSLADIGPKDVLAALDEIVDAGKPVAANRAYSVLRRFFGWCIERHLIQTNPAAAVRRPAKEVSRSRVLADDELRDIWKHAGNLGWPFGPFIRTLMLTGQRRNEVAGMQWSEIDEDKRLWVIPAARTKNAREHVVPITDALASILKAAPRFTSDASGPVFTMAGQVHISGFSRSKDRLESKIAEVREKPIPGWTLHDLRRSVATGMGTLAVQPQIIEAALNHSSGYRAGVAGIYQRQTYWPERQAAFKLWAEHVEGLGRTALKIVPKKRRG